MTGITDPLVFSRVAKTRAATAGFVPVGYVANQAGMDALSRTMGVLEEPQLLWGLPIKVVPELFGCEEPTIFLVVKP